MGEREMGTIDNGREQYKFSIERINKDNMGKVFGLIENYAKEGLMLHRSLEEIEKDENNYFVCTIDNEVAGCIALKDWDGANSEIYAFAVNSKHIGKGIGSKLIDECIIEANKKEIKLLFALTFRGKMFIKKGFKKIEANSLPDIVFTEKTVKIDKAYGMNIKN